MFKEKRDVRNHNSYWGVKLLENAIKIVERALEKIRELVNVETTQFDFVPGRGTTDVLFALRMQEEYKHKEKIACVL